MGQWRGIKHAPFEIIAGMTEIEHQSQDSTSVPNPCPTADCFNLTLNYSIKLSQIKSLMKISNSCQQYIKVGGLPQFYQVVVSTVMSGILFARFPTVDYVNNNYSFLSMTS